MRGRILVKLRRFEQATLAFDRYLDHEGKPIADIYRERGLARMQLGKYLGAVDDYTQALALELKEGAPADAGPPKVESIVSPPAPAGAKPGGAGARPALAAPRRPGNL